MLTITETAVDFLAQAREQSDIPSDATLRIGTPSDGDIGGITLGFVEEPFAGDAVGEAHGLPVCVAPEISATLEDAVLDVMRDEEGPRLVLVQQD